MTLKFWVKIIPVRWSKSGQAARGAVAAAGVCCAVPVVRPVASKLSPIAIEKRRTPLRARPCCATPKRIAPIRTAPWPCCFWAPPKTMQHQFGDALTHLKSAAKRLPELADYVAYLSAVADSGLRQFNDTEPALQPVWQSTPASPLVTKAVLLQAESYLQGGNPASAVTLVQQHLADLPTPQAELLLARAYEAQNDAGARPRSIIKRSTSSIRCRKKRRMPKRRSPVIPAFPPEALFARGLKLEAGGDYTRAGKELTELLPRLSGESFDLARVRIGAAAYLARDNEAAYKYLISFQATAPDAEAERLYYLLECQRRLNRLDEMNATLEKLAQSYPQSHWRLEALVAVANYYVAHDQPDAAQPLYRTCFETFPNESQSAACHWKVTWSTYLRDPAQAESMLREHLTRYAASDQTSPALYYLGRIAESKSDWSTARAYYDAVNNAYPELLLRDSRARASGDAVRARHASASPATAQFLERHSNRNPPSSGKLRSHAAHQAAHRASAFARHCRPGRSVGSRASLRRQSGRPAASDRDRIGRSGHPARCSRPGHPLHQTLRARLSVHVARCGARQVLASGLPAALSQVAGRILPRADAGSLFDGRADSPGIGVQSQGGLVAPTRGVWRR